MMATITGIENLTIVVKQPFEISFLRHLELKFVHLSMVLQSVDTFYFKGLKEQVCC